MKHARAAFCGDPRSLAKIEERGRDMKDLSKDELEDSRPSQDAVFLVNFCLERLYEDKEHVLNDLVVKGLTFEELIGSLLKVRDEITWEDEDGARRV